MKAKIFNSEIPFYELLNNDLSGGEIFTVKSEGLKMTEVEMGDYPEYSEFVDTDAFRDILRAEREKLRYGDSKTVRISSFNINKSKGVLEVGFHPSSYSVYKAFNAIKHYPPQIFYRDAGHGLFEEGTSDWLDTGITGNLIRANHCGTGLFIDCAGPGGVRVIVGMRPNREIIDTHRLFRTYSASGSIDLDDLTPFEGVLREAREEINFEADASQIELVSFGYDSQLGYFQFSFYHRSELSFEEIVAGAKGAKDANEYTSLDPVAFSAENIDRTVRDIAEAPWEPSALWTLVVLVARLILSDGAKKGEKSGVTAARIDDFRNKLEKEIKNRNYESNFKIFN